MEDIPPAIPLIVKKEHWPETDRIAVDALFELGDDWGEGGGPGVSWSNGTIAIRMQGYGEWMSYVYRIRPDLLPLPPCKRVTRDTVRDYYTEAEQRGLRPKSIATKLSALAEVMIAMAPREDWKWLRNASRSFLRESSHQDLKPLPKVTARQIFDFAIDRLRMVRAETNASLNSPPLLTAVEFRQALMVAVLMTCPVRRRALLAMTVSEHIERVGTEIFLCFKAADMKDKKARRILLHGSLELFLLEYLDLYRPLLLREQESQMLWISSRKNGYGADSFTSYMAIYTERHFGEGFRSHKFRHIAATYIAEEMPEHAGIIADILGHSGPETAEKYYNRAQAKKANRKLKTLYARFKKPGEKS